MTQIREDGKTNLSMIFLAFNQTFMLLTAVFLTQLITHLKL